MLPHSDLFTSYARTYETRRDSEMSLAEYLEGCRDDPMMYASAPERVLAAIGEAELVDTAKRRSPRPYLHEPNDPHLSGICRVLRNGGDDRADRQLLPARSAGSGRAEADPLSARPGRRRQIFTGRASEGSRGTQPIYVLKAGDELSPVFESPLGLFDAEQMGECWKIATASRAAG